LHQIARIALALGLAACGGGQAAPPPAAESTPGGTSGAENAATPGAAVPAASAEADADADDEFVTRTSDDAQATQAVKASKIKSTATEAALKFFVIDKDKGPVEGIVISVAAPDGAKYYTEETDAGGYAELLVPIGRKYEVTYLSLGRRDIAAKLSVSDEPKQNIKLTLRYKRYEPPPGAAEPRFVLDGVYFDSGKTTIRADSFARLDTVVEYMTHKKSARIEISGHTDNLGNAKTNKTLSQKRAQACRDYLISKSIDGGRIVAVGYGDERPITSNESEEGRQKNRRIEASEL
jgi:outer membrane protein OmpA-like peptidoglycan-associated protein